MQSTADAINFIDAQFASASAAQYSVLVTHGVSPFRGFGAGDKME
jgi:hypothetical protein